MTHPALDETTAPPSIGVRAVIVDRGPDSSISARVGTAKLGPLPPFALLVRPAYIGICGTDLEILHGRMPETFLINYPHIMGHEWSGVVEQVGESVTGFNVGDRVLGHGHLGGNDWFGVTHDGAAAELFHVPAAMCFPVPDSVDMLTAAMIEPFACVLTGVKKIGGISAADTVHIHGLGAIGLAALVQAVTAGAKTVVFDPSTRRRQAALEIGAAAAFNPLETADINTAAADAIGHGFADVVIEASGNPAAQAAALESADHNGRVLLMGVSKPKSAPARLGLLQERNLTITSSTGAPVDVWPAAIRYVERAKIDLGAIVSSIHPFADAEEAIRCAEDSEAEIKVMLSPTPVSGVGAAK
ncbi:zinc-binding dehydrogenase [Arthrobacter sp. Marseille-P9274]|uniref:zinc-dependent alcohol dehydrogenase n=1 Tax=Arthrobacter sp. Marseille-P9274 TaxID=2866572 RepID=UPI0021C58B4B|nr:zinc-binding dehydrogenase [Arthrobacter sp. Marseille-P9274]